MASEPADSIPNQKIWVRVEAKKSAEKAKV